MELTSDGASENHTPPGSQKTTPALRRFLFPGSRKDDTGFSEVLQNTQSLGLRTAGWLAIALAAVYVLGKCLAGARLIVAARQLEVGEVLLIDKAVMALIGAGLIVAGRRRVSVSVGRGLAALCSLIFALATLYSDILRGTASAGYLATVFAGTAVLIPFRPWQTLALGAGMTLGLLGAGPVGRPLVGLPPEQPAESGQVVQMVVLTGLMTGVSAVLYRSRHRQYRLRRRAEALNDELTDIEEARSRFLANISHELRTPLTLIASPLRDALDGRYGSVPDPLAGRLERVLDQAKRLQTLVGQLLDLAELEEGTVRLNARALPVRPTLRRIRRRFRDAADRRGITLEVQADASVQAGADPEALEKIVGNLVRNALEHTPEGGTVRITADPPRDRRPEEGAASTGSKDARQMAVRVANTGPGIPDGVRDQLFQRYVTGESRTDGSEGTGLGLSLVRELTRRHQGSIELRDQDGATEFAVRLPASPAALPPEDRAPDDARSPEPASNGSAPNDGPRKPAGSAHPRRKENAAGTAASRSLSTDLPGSDEGRGDEAAPLVLVVDDEREIRRYLRESLEPEYRVAGAGSAAEALETARDRRPALLISDVRMPGADGFELCRRIREDEALRAMPVVLLTVEPREDGEVEGLRVGADAYVSKPFDPEALRQRVENLIDVRRYLRDRGNREEEGGEAASGTAPRVESGEADEEKEAREGASESPSADDARSEIEQAAREAVMEHVDNSAFGVEWLADEVDLSARHLQRRLKAETGLSAAAFIRALRLKHAADLLRSGDVETVRAASSAVGYRDASYFSRLFKEAHGRPPSDLKP